MMAWTMRPRPVSLLLACVFVGACARQAPLTTEPVPEWLAALVREFEQVANPPPLVARYDYRDQVVYYVAPRCCDIFSVLYDSAGVIICAPDGGLTGQGDGQCPDFFAQRTNEKILWRPRHDA